MALYTVLRFQEMLSRFGVSFDYVFRGSWHDFTQKFALSKLGVFWHTLSTLLTAATLFFVFSRIFDTANFEYFLHICIGLVHWNFFSTVTVDASSLYNSQKSVLHNTQISNYSVLLRYFFTNTTIFYFNIVLIVIIPSLFFYNNHLIDIMIFAFTTINYVAFAFCMSLLTFELGRRFADFTPLYVSLLQILFFVTPIFWQASSVLGGVKLLIWNPLYFYFEGARAALAKDISSTSLLGYSLIFTILSITFISVLKKTTVKNVLH